MPFAVCRSKLIESQRVHIIQPNAFSSAFIIDSRHRTECFMCVLLNIPHNTLEIGTAIIPSLYMRRLRLPEVKKKVEDKWLGRGRAGFELRPCVSRLCVPLLRLP